MTTSKKAPRDPWGRLFHSLLTPEAERYAPKEKKVSLGEKLNLYADVDRRLRKGLLPEDALTALMNQIIQLSGDAKMPDDTLSGWFREELRAYRQELKAGGLEAILSLPELPRPFEEKVHDHFASRR